MVGHFVVRKVKWKGVGTSSGGAFNIAGIGRLYSVTPSSLNSSAVVRERMVGAESDSSSIREQSLRY